MTKLLSVFVLIFCTSAHSESWTVEQKILSATYMATHVIDWGQTREIAKHPKESGPEYNPLLGSEPSPGKVNAYFLLTPVLWYYALDNIPQYRTVALTVLNLVQIGVVAHNYHVGIKVSF